MSSFDARLRLPGHSRIPLGVEVDITDERMTLTTGEKRLGEWPLGEVDIAAMSDGFHIKLDGEEVILSVADIDRFESELGSVVKRPRRPTLPRPDQDRFAGIRERIGALREMAESEHVPPSEVFRTWLRLLKEINLHHGQGAMPTQLFYRLNTELLEVIPEPQREPVPAAAS